MFRISRSISAVGVLAGMSITLTSMSSAQAAVNAQRGIVQKEEKCPAAKPYSDLDEFGKFYFSEAVYEQARTQTDHECRHIWYLSDEIPVSGYIF